MAGEDADQAILNSFARQFNPLEQHLATIKEGTERIKTIVKDLKMSSHMVDDEKTTVVITDIITSTVNLIAAKYSQSIDLLTDFKATPQVNCYPAKLNQVFMNLIVNGCDALLGEDEVLESEKDSEDSEHQGLTSTVRGQIVVGCQIQGDWVEITVKDNGCGMSEETKSKLFEPFYTTKGIDKGTGLGLSISYDIVQKHGGELSVESELGVGTVFTLTLPV